MQHSHTKGPWQVKQGAGVYISGQSARLADIPDALEDETGESMANARLMAAAPALLHALEHFLARGDCAAATARIKAKYENEAANIGWAVEQEMWNEIARSVIRAATEGA